MLRGARLVFLDELHAHDPGDAMILSRILLALPVNGATLVATEVSDLSSAELFGIDDVVVEVISERVGELVAGRRAQPAAGVAPSGRGRGAARANP